MNPLIAHLQKLYDNDDRGALAALRRGLGKPPGTFAAAFPHVLPFIKDDDNRPGRDGPYFLVASLFALHPDPGARGDLGWTCRQLGDHESAEKRFRALLAANEVELPGRLRQVVALARSKQVPIDWEQLLQHLLQWTHPERWVQRRWASAYWAPRTDPSNPETTP